MKTIFRQIIWTLFLALSFSLPSHAGQYPKYYGLWGHTTGLGNERVCVIKEGMPYCWGWASGRVWTNYNRIVG